MLHRQQRHLSRALPLTGLPAGISHLGLVKHTDPLGDKTPTAPQTVCTRPPKGRKSLSVLPAEG